MSTPTIGIVLVAPLASVTSSLANSSTRSSMVPVEAGLHAHVLTVGISRHRAAPE